MRRIGSTLTVALLCLAGIAAAGNTRTPPRGAYAQVNGLRMYYEVHGKGRPLVLLHGGVSTVEKDFGKLIPLLSRTRKVIALEQQGHGHTADVDRPLGYAQMAADTLALLDQLGVERADFFGYSMGGTIATEIAVRHPERVGKLVVAAVGVNREGFQPGFFEQMETITPEVMAGSPWQLEYARVAPDPAGWAGLLGKIKGLARGFAGWTPEEIRAIQAPTLVIVGDSDVVRAEHTVELYRLRGGGAQADDAGGRPHFQGAQLAILPGTSHVTLIDQTSWLVSMITTFLD